MEFRKHLVIALIFGDLKFGHKYNVYYRDKHELRHPKPIFYITVLELVSLTVNVLVWGLEHQLYVKFVICHLIKRTRNLRLLHKCMDSLGCMILKY
jgi:hypothetical protein